MFYRNKLAPVAKKFKDITFVICDEQENHDFIRVKIL